MHELSSTGRNNRTLSYEACSPTIPLENEGEQKLSLRYDGDGGCDCCLKAFAARCSLGKSVQVETSVFRLHSLQPGLVNQIMRFLRSCLETRRQCTARQQVHGLSNGSRLDNTGLNNSQMWYKHSAIKTARWRENTSPPHPVRHKVTRGRSCLDLQQRASLGMQRLI